MSRALKHLFPKTRVQKQKSRLTRFRASDRDFDSQAATVDDAQICAVARAATSCGANTLAIATKTPKRHRRIPEAGVTQWPMAESAGYDHYAGLCLQPERRFIPAPKFVHPLCGNRFFSRNRSFQPPPGIFRVTLRIKSTQQRCSVRSIVNQLPRDGTNDGPTTVHPTPSRHNLRRRRSRTRPNSPALRRLPIRHRHPR